MVALSSIRWPGVVATIALSGLLASYLYTIIFLEKPRPRQVVGRNNTILMAVNSASGLSNVHIATAFSLAKNYPLIEIHFASFDKLWPEVERVSAAAGGQPFNFHNFKTTSLEKCIARNFGNEEGLISPPGLKGVMHFTENIQKTLMPWTVEEYFTIFNKTMDFINEIDPAVVVLDSLLAPAIDATRQTNRVHAFLSPNALIDVLFPKQPNGAMFWKYPILATGYPFPLPWHLIPANTWAAFKFVYALTYSREISSKQTALKALGIENPFDFMSIIRDDVPWITSEFKEARLQLDYIPPNITECRPMVVSIATAEEQDTRLAEWLAKGPTILVNLGSITRYDNTKASVMATSLRKVLEESSDMQVLWKLKKHETYEDHAIEPLQGFMKSGRARVDEWLDVDPTALLDTGNIVLSVHHGGANCFFEAIRAGIPHVVLPMWVDLYNFANLEYLGVGVYASKKTAPDWTVEELSAAILKVIGDKPEGVAMRTKAIELGAIAKKEEGRDCAARELAKLASTRH